MDDIGVETELFATQQERMNLGGIYKGTGKGKSLMFNGHVDVVKPGELSQWKGRDPYGGQIEDGYIYGRGTADMKGGLAASMFALKGIIDAGYKPVGDVVYQFAVGEECKETEAGTGACLDKGYLADAAIVCEPTCFGDRVFDVAIAQPGALAMRWHVQGKSCHAGARRELIASGGAGEAVGVDGIEKGMIIYNAIIDLERRWGQTKTHPLFLPGSFNLNGGVIKAGIGHSFVSPDMEVAYSILYNPSETAEEVRKEVEECIHNASQNDLWLRDNPPTVYWDFDWPAFVTPSEEPICVTVQDAVREIVPEGGELHPFFAVCDACFIQDKGIPVVAMGPGQGLVCHTADERISIDQLVEAAKIYALAIANWCGIE